MSVSYMTLWRRRNPEKARRMRDRVLRRLRTDRRYRLRFNAQQRRYRRALKLAAYEAYGGMVCKCCGETEELFLTVDHTKRDGAAHRRRLGTLSTNTLYRWLRDNGYPKGFRVLCFNCNLGRERNHGRCPHRRRK